LCFDGFGVLRSRWDGEVGCEGLISNSQFLRIFEL
jgi:hypothetical protein